MSANCPKCGQTVSGETARVNHIAAYRKFLCGTIQGIDNKGDIGQTVECIRAERSLAKDAQIAALTQRAEQAESERDERQKWRDRWLTKYMELFCTVREVTEDEFMDHFGSEPEHFEALSVATKLTEAEAEVKRLRELLREIEWGGSHFTEPWCPVCGGDVDLGGHEADCKLAALLAQPSDGKETTDAQ